jgi:hypothetical protein
MPEDEVLRILRLNSEEMGRERGEAQRAATPDTSFQSFTAPFRQMLQGNSLVGEITEDTEDVFELEVTECIWASVFKEAGLDGDIGHASVCNMDYAWPVAFNPDFKMERSKTLMQGHECCNHRYVDTKGRTG